MTAGEDKEEAFVGQVEGQLDDGDEVLADLEGRDGGQRRPALHAALPHSPSLLLAG